MSAEKSYSGNDATSPNAASQDGDTLNQVASAEAQIVVPTPADIPPNGGYGWVCVAVVALINAHTWGINSSYGVFLAYYLSHDTFHGASTLDFAFVGGLSIAMALLISPVATIAVRILGTRTTLFIGIFFQTISLIGASFAKQIWQLFLSQGICFGWGMGFLFVASVGITPQWFSTKRSLANGLSAAGSGLGGLIYSLATNTMIMRIGLGWAFRILAIVSCIVLIVCSLLVRDRNKQVGSSLKAFDHTLLRRTEFLLLLSWGFFSMLGYIVLLFSLPNYATYIGLTAHQGSIVGALLNLGQALGRGPIGYYSDAIGRINMAMSMTFICAIFSFAIWIPSHSFAPLIVFALTVGPVAGTFWATVAPVTAEVVGLKNLPAGLSITWVVLAVPCTFSEVIALEIAERTSSRYLGTQLFAGFMYIAAAGSLYCVRVWKVGELQRAALRQSNRHSDGSTNEDGFVSDEKLSSISMRQRLFAWVKV